MGIQLGQHIEICYPSSHAVWAAARRNLRESAVHCSIAGIPDQRQISWAFEVIASSHASRRNCQGASHSEVCHLIVRPGRIPTAQLREAFRRSAAIEGSIRA